MMLDVIDPRPTRLVACGSCTSCCRGDAIFLHPECGDDTSRYETEKYRGRTILAHKDNGDCIYLDRDHGCTIHDRRPTICREMDCVVLLERLGEKRLIAMGLKRIAYAARRLRRNGIGSRED